MPSPRIKLENENLIHFITITTIEWIDIFTKPQYFQIIIDSLKYCQENKGLLLYEYVIMTNHIHLIVQAGDGNKLSQIVSDFKKHTTREVIKLLQKDNRKYIIVILNNSFRLKKGYKNQVWQRENYPEVIETEKFFMSKVNYIHQNPVKKEYVHLAENYIYSSARNRILGDESIIQVEDYWNI